jgi:hypothetical protein
MSHEDERRALDAVIQRLQDRFPDEPADRISRVVGEVSADLGPARIRDYLPVLVEKEARKRLRSPREPVC